MHQSGTDQLRWKLGQIAHRDTHLEALEYATEFLDGHVNQHYLARGSLLEMRESGLSDDACAALRTIWDLTKVQDNPLIKTHRTLTHLAKDQQSGREKKVAVTLVPLGAFGRVWSGDFGDACFTRLHEQLADGGFARVTAYALVTGRNTPNEKINGSVLLIETSTPNGDPVLMIRANNPSKNLLRRVDAEDLIVQCVEHVKSLTAAEGTSDGIPFRYVVVPLDNTSESSTNREEVNQVYWQLYSQAVALGLTNEPETNFNDYYDNWNSLGSYRCVVIHENTDLMNQTAQADREEEPGWFSKLLGQC
jgi:hypothetical protein